MYTSSINVKLLLILVVYFAILLNSVLSYSKLPYTIINNDLVSKYFKNDTFPVCSMCNKKKGPLRSVTSFLNENTIAIDNVDNFENLFKFKVELYFAGKTNNLLLGSTDGERQYIKIKF